MTLVHLALNLYSERTSTRKKPITVGRHGMWEGARAATRGIQLPTNTGLPESPVSCGLESHGKLDSQDKDQSLILVCLKNHVSATKGSQHRQPWFLASLQKPHKAHERGLPSKAQYISAQYILPPTPNPQGHPFLSTEAQEKKRQDLSPHSMPKSYCSGRDWMPGHIICLWLPPHTQADGPLPPTCFLSLRCPVYWCPPAPPPTDLLTDTSLI